MTERPEERDSLADVVKRLDEVATYGIADTLSPLSAELLVIARTLINEVKERDRRVEETRAFYRDLNKKLAQQLTENTDEFATLEAEAKELRERAEHAERELQRVAKNYGWFEPDGPTRLEQMEEALRKAVEELEWLAPPHGLTEKRCPKEERIREAEHLASKVLGILRAALSPLDTEEGTE